MRVLIRTMKSTLSTKGINLYLLMQKCRHASISLEMLLKLVVVFGPMIHSTLSAPPAVGVDLHAEQRYR